jgi:hypothetical protein
MGDCFEVSQEENKITIPNKCSMTKTLFKILPNVFFVQAKFLALCIQCQGF